MAHARGYRGWMAAMSVGVTLTLVLMAVGKYAQLPIKRNFYASQRVVSRAVSTSRAPALPTSDPGRAVVHDLPLETNTPILRREETVAEFKAVEHLRRPPEPVSNIMLQTPTPSVEVVGLPLHNSSSDIEMLMGTMDQALASPMQVTATRSPATTQANVSNNAIPKTALASPVTSSARVPEPKRLLVELMQLEDAIRSGGHLLSRLTAGPGRFVSKTTSGPHVLNSADMAQYQAISVWIAEVRTVIESIVMHHGLEHPGSYHETQRLALLAAQAAELGQALTNYDHAKQMIRVAYSLRRRVAVWQAVQACLDPTSIALNRSKGVDLARDSLRTALADVQQLLSETGDPESWRTYLLLDRLDEWVASPQNIWSEGNDLALDALSRLKWERLSGVQREFLARSEFKTLASHLESWSRDPVDYRRLLVDLEELETNPLDRGAASLAGAVQVLRTSPEPKQQALADALNSHYRNANMRLSVSRQLIERFLPEGEVEVRPIRRKILGADTNGNSTIKTQLGLKFLPSPDGWHVGIGVVGDLFSNTASSKGPATFHNTSTAQISSMRTIRLDPMGYRVSADPTSVQSHDTLRKMSTDFDGLPIIGDFVRMVVREQFDQKRGLAQRVSQRIMAKEADAEFDRRIQEGLAKAESELEQRITGPLHRLQLNPMVVSMSTTEERLGIRYRVASRSQMASHTPRPRAPSDSLLSMQVHQSTINNTIASIGLGGKTWELAALCSRLGEVFGQGNWTLPDDVPDDITIRFAERQPAFVNIVDGKLRLTLRIAELRTGGTEPIQRIIVTSSYIPLADGLTAELIRDGVVEINASPRTPIRHKLKARFIFAKVFVSRPKISLISQAWQDDPRAEGLAVSQLELRDSWLSVAISDAKSAHAVEVATRSRLIKQNY